MSWDMDKLHLALTQQRKADVLLYNMKKKTPYTASGDIEKILSATHEKAKYPDFNDVIASRNLEFNEIRSRRDAEYRRLDKEKENLMFQIKYSKKKSHFLPPLPRAVSSSGRSSVQGEGGSAFDDGLSEYARSGSSQSDPGIGALLERIATRIPADQARYDHMKHVFESEKLKRTKPYNGELGPQSYKSWQMMDYFMVRSLVEEFVDVALNSMFNPLNKYPVKMALTQREYMKEKYLAMNSKVIQLLMEQIYLEETAKFSREIADETIAEQAYIRTKSISSFATIIQTVCTKGKQMTVGEHDNRYQMALKLLKLKTTERKYSDQKKSDIFSHRQHLHLHRNGRRGLMDESFAKKDQTKLLDFNYIVPVDLLECNRKPKTEMSKDETERLTKFVDYQENEIHYWMKMKPFCGEIIATTECSGLVLCRSSFNQRYLAMVTANSDILVIDFFWRPPKPVRIFVNTTDDKVVHLAWNLSSTQLITVSEKGALNILSFQHTDLSKTKPPKAKDLVIESDANGFLPAHLLLLFKLESTYQDFKFYTGPLAETSNQADNLKPVIAAFHPSLTLLGSQPSVVVVLENKEILKCDLGDQLYGAEDQVDTTLESPTQIPTIINQPKANNLNGSRPNKIGNEVPAELFRSHEHPIIFLGFVKNCQDMISIDLQGFIFIWKYNNKSEKWFTPSQRYKLNMNKISYVPSASPQVLFSEQSSEVAAEVEQSRNTAENLLHSALKNFSVWHQRCTNDRLLLTRMYMPSHGVRPAGDIFHVVTRHCQSSQLCSYLTQLYIPTDVQCTNLIQCKMSPSGSQMVVLLLFSEKSPIESHITILVLDLCEMSLLSFRQDVFLVDESLYDRCLKEDIVSCDITEPLDVTGSRYVFLSLDGQLFGYSVSTGQQVLHMVDPKRKLSIPDFKGIKVDRALPVNSQLTVISRGGQIFVCLYAPNLSKSFKNPLLILSLKDENGDKERSEMLRSFQLWYRGVGLVEPTEQCLASKRLLTGDEVFRQLHPKAYARQIIFSIIDDAMDRVDSADDHSKGSPVGIRRIHANLRKEVEVKQF